MKKGLYPNFGFSGLTSCGKSSHASFFAKKFSMSIISASATLIEQGKRNKLHDVHIENTHNHPWIRSFDEFNKNRMVDLSIDTSIDEYVYDIVSQGYGMIAESLTLPFLLTKRKQKLKTMLFYLHASHEKRVARAFRSSPTLSMEELNIGVLKKDIVSQKIIQNIWGTDILNIEEQFFYSDVVLNTDVIDNGDPHDDQNADIGKTITRSAIENIINYSSSEERKPLDYLKKLADIHPNFFYKLPNNIWKAIQ